MVRNGCPATEWGLRRAGIEVEHTVTFKPNIFESVVSQS